MENNDATKGLNTMAHRNDMHAIKVSIKTERDLREVITILTELADQLRNAEYNPEGTNPGYIDDKDPFTIYDAMDSLMTVARDMRAWLAPHD